MKRSEYNKIKEEGLELMRKAGLYLTPEEEERMEVTDFGLNNPYEEGLMLHVYVNTKRCCAKELPMLPGQICAEHRHPPLSPENPGKEETFRCRYGEVYVHVPGEPTANPKARIPQGKDDVYTVWHEIVLKRVSSIPWRRTQNIGSRLDRRERSSLSFLHTVMMGRMFIRIRLLQGLRQ